MQQANPDLRKSPRKEVLAPAVIHMEKDGKVYRSQAIVRNISMEGMLVALYDYDEDLKELDLENVTAKIRFRCSDADTEYVASCLTNRAEKLTYSIQISAVITKMSPEHLQAMQRYCS
ncbi:hypothetical protein SAMN05660653_02946 [Desulfonatronum thiosulfatophilum]|uniref:PilZ domain-containing protein n=1 Tax=Desulfonatronum thiosulfatophilum TaxID=617002 RepID=A0A1G6ELI9_9BACT|nr:PilZ domain-containing protein [Desulfonatronum thiosulfatophilum]SDB58260.1 hypothetical protein SAMN05660653_02946 [Desulfonatronum thiosulfatophilum]